MLSIALFAAWFPCAATDCSPSWPPLPLTRSERSQLESSSSTLQGHRCETRETASTTATDSTSPTTIKDHKC